MDTLTATLQRVYQNDCTVGMLNLGNFRCFTLELPWKDNQKNISCIPAGVYKCNKILSPSLGECIEIYGVSGRDYIRIHAGNYTSQIQGCVLVGASLTDINHDGTPDVTSSRNTLAELMRATPKTFMLEIK